MRAVWGGTLGCGDAGKVVHRQMGGLKFAELIKTLGTRQTPCRAFSLQLSPAKCN